MNEQLAGMHRLQAINMAIWLRDNHHRISKELLVERLQEITEYGLFSNRQLATIIDNRITHATISNYVQKSDRTGGKINPKSLEEIREILFSKSRGRTNYKMLAKVVSEGTSQGMVSKLTGVNQSLISKKVGINVSSIS